MTEEALYQGEFHPTLNEMSGKTMAQSIPTILTN
jgi:hypothetical protein